MAARPPPYATDLHHRWVAAPTEIEMIRKVITIESQEALSLANRIMGWGGWPSERSSAMRERTEQCSTPFSSTTLNPRN